MEKLKAYLRKVARLPKKEYTTVALKVPILTVDALIESKDGYLLVRRANEPLKGEFWTPGGRVYKGESLTEALKRVVKEETGLTVKSFEQVGMYEDIYEKNEQGITYTHTVSVVFRVQKWTGTVTIDTQSTAFKWSAKLPKKLKIK